MIYSVDPRLKSIRDKVESGERLSLDDGILMYQDDIPVNDLGQLANLVRERKNGNAAYYNINTHLNATNVCVYRCIFCAFRADLRSPRGYVMSDEQVLQRGREAVENGCTELHIVGGLHHQKKFDWYLNLIQILHDAYPDLHLKGWTAVEINWFEFLTKSSTAEVLQQLIDAGLGSMPGGGAEIFHPEVRDKICEHKADSNNWIQIHRTAHQLGLPTNCTMFVRTYRATVSPGRPPDSAARTSGRNRRIPDLHPAGISPGKHGIVPHQEAIRDDDLRTIAVSRLMLDNIPHIKAYWIMLGIGTAQAALAYGADDLGRHGTA